MEQHAGTLLEKNDLNKKLEAETRKYDELKFKTKKIRRISKTVYYVFKYIKFLYSTESLENNKERLKKKVAALIDSNKDQ